MPMMSSLSVEDARTAFRASGRAVVEGAVLYADGPLVMRESAPAVFVIPERLLGWPVELLDEDEAAEAVAVVEDSLR